MRASVDIESEAIHVIKDTDSRTNCNWGEPDAILPSIETRLHNELNKVSEKTIKLLNSTVILGFCNRIDIFDGNAKLSINKFEEKKQHRIYNEVVYFTPNENTYWKPIFFRMRRGSLAFWFLVPNQLCNHNNLLIIILCLISPSNICHCLLLNIHLHGRCRVNTNHRSASIS